MKVTGSRLPIEQTIPQGLADPARAEAATIPKTRLLSLITHRSASDDAREPCPSPTTMPATVTICANCGIRKNEADEDGRACTSAESANNPYGYYPVPMGAHLWVEDEWVEPVIAPVSYIDCVQCGDIAPVLADNKPKYPTHHGSASGLCGWCALEALIR